VDFSPVRSTGSWVVRVLFSLVQFPAKNLLKTGRYLSEYECPNAMGGSVMSINDLTSAIIEKRETVQRLKAEIQQIEKDLETLTAAARILERGSSSHFEAAPPPPGPASVRGVAHENIKKAFP
jgi:hypothetical protein